LYKLHLIFKYLRKRRIAWVSLLAVCLCTAMVLVVISVMGGWLRMFRTSFHGLSGDVVVQGNSLTGFPYYQDMIREIEKLPEVSAAVPVVQTFGLININNMKTMGVQVLGYPIDRVGEVNEFPHSLWRQYNEPIEKAEQSRGDVDKVRERMNKVHPSFDLRKDVDYKTEFRINYPRASERVVNEAPTWDGLIAGNGVVNIRKGPDGKIDGHEDFLYRLPCWLTVIGVSSTGKIDVAGGKAERPYWIVDTSRTKVWQYDSNTVYVPFHVLQKDLGMEEQQAEQNSKPITIPGRTSEIHIRVKEPWSKSSEGLMAVAEKVRKAVDAVVSEKSAAGAYSGTKPVVRTWEQSQAKWLGAIEKEKTLVTGLFGFISIVAIFLIFCIFYMIVVEKTRDIGIIKSVGATPGGVVEIFLGYGAIIGIIGSGLGLLAGYLIVHNINTLHDWLGRALGVQVWDPEVYAFDTIPNTMDFKETMIIVGVAIVSSVLGALVPAVIAGNKNPVEALRWE
jgi:lipoprotein-releasing system permease protein